MTKKALVLSAALAAAVSSGASVAEVTGNLGVGSNYIWRGVTQTLDQASISGGIDWGHESGVYAGTWVSNVDYSDVGTQDTGYEFDGYAGFAGESGGIGYDVGVIAYMYPVTPEAGFTELYLTGSYSMFSLGAYFTVDKASGITDPAGDDDLYITASVDLAPVSIYVGDYSFDADPASDYSHYGVSLAMDDFTFSLDKNDIESGNGKDDNVRATVSWSKSFEL